MISLPTLFSKYSQYFDLDQTTHDFVVDSSATPVVTITNLKYKDHTQDSAPTVNKNWKTVLQGVYSDLSAAAGSRDYATAFTKVWDIMTALYDPDDASGATMNVHFRTPALQAKMMVFQHSVIIPSCLQFRELLKAFLTLPHIPMIPITSKLILQPEM